MFLRKLFNLHIYSTAEKIIECVTAHLRNEIFSDINFFTPSLYLYKEQDLIHLLGDLISDIWGEEVYSQYQKLSDASKNDIRQKIVSIYFDALQFTSDKIKNRMTFHRRTTGNRSVGASEYCIYYVERAFCDVTSLRIMLGPVLSEIKQKIEIKSNEYSVNDAQFDQSSLKL